jgi:hypothetical protein
MTPVQILKLVTPTIIFYVAVFAAIFISGEIDPGGPCVPGLAFIAFMLSIPIVIALLVRNIYLAICKDKQNLIVVFLHAIVLVFVLSIL